MGRFRPPVTSRCSLYCLFIFVFLPAMLVCAGRGKATGGVYAGVRVGRISPEKFDGADFGQVGVGQFWTGQYFTNVLFSLIGGSFGKKKF